MENVLSQKFLANVDEQIGDRRILEEVARERHAQRAKWGIQSLPLGFGRHDDWQVAEFYKTTTNQNMQDGTISWRDVLSEEVFEAYAEEDVAAARAELVQVAAVAVAAIRDIDSGRLPAGGNGI